jgi:competence protein ComEC
MASPTAERRAAELVAAALAWLLGLVLLHQCERLPSPPEWAGLFAAVVLAGAAVWRLPAWRWAALVLLVGIGAFGQAALRAQARLSQQLPAAWEARDLVLTGRVDSLPIAVQGQGGVPGWRFGFAVESVNEGQVPDRLMLLAYAAPGGEAPRLLAGERWRWTARLKRPHGLSNPNGFDAELWLFEQGLRATGTVRPGSAQKLSEAPWWVIDAWRQRLRERLHEQLPDAAMAGVLAALSLGDQAAIAKPDWNLFRDTGVAHLLRIR